MKTISDQLKKAIQDSGKSRYQISKESGVSQPQLSRFMSSERDLRLQSVDEICKALNLELKQKGRKSS